MLLILQCDSGHLYGNLLACARYLIDDERAKSNQLELIRRGSHSNDDYLMGNTHILFIINLPRQADINLTTSSSFIGFQGGAWVYAHIDDIRPPPETALTLDEALSAPISQLFYNGTFVNHTTTTTATAATANRPVVDEGTMMEVDEEGQEEMRDEEMEVEGGVTSLVIEEEEERILNEREASYMDTSFEEPFDEVSYKGNF